MNNSVKTVDVIIVTFNRLRYLQSLIKSLFLQNPMPEKIIIYDDLSDDGTYEFLLALENKWSFINVLRGKTKSQSVSASRNKCLKLCTSEIVIVMDDDDLMPKDKIKNTLEAFEGNDIVAVTGNSKMFNTDTFQVSHHNLTEGTGEFLVDKIDLMKGNKFHWASFAFRRDALNKIGGFDEKYRMIVDWVLYLELFNIGNIKVTPAVLGYYRIHNGNFSENLDILVKDLQCPLLHSKFGDFGVVDYLFAATFRMFWREKRYFSALFSCFEMRFKTVNRRRRFIHFITGLFYIYDFFVYLKKPRWSKIDCRSEELIKLIEYEKVLG